MNYWNLLGNSSPTSKSNSEEKTPKKAQAIAYAELKVEWLGGGYTYFSVVFYDGEDANERKWIVASGNNSGMFGNTAYFAPCETWRHTGLLPEWAKDPIAEKLTR